MSLWKVLTGTYDGTNYDKVRIDSSTNSLQVVDYAHHEVHSGSAFYTEGHTTLADTNNFYASFTTPSGTKYCHIKWAITSNGITDIAMYEGSSGGMAGGSIGVVHAHNRNVSCFTGLHDGGDNDATVMTDSGASFSVDALIDMYIYNQTDGSRGKITDNDGTSITVGSLAGGTGNDWDDDDVYEVVKSNMLIGVGHAVPDVFGALITDTAFGGSGFKADVGGGTSREQEIIAKPDTTYVLHILSGSDDNVVTFNLDWYEHTDKH